MTSTKVAVVLSESVAEVLDDEARVRQISRSELIRNILTLYVRHIRETW